MSSLLHQLGGSIGGTIPFACQDWANTKAAYRFLSNDDVDEQAILSGHFQATRDRAHACGGPLLILQDTTEFSYKRDKPELIGFKGVTHSRRDEAGRPQPHTTCGILMHSSVAVTTQGLPLGLCAIKFWSRQKFKGSSALRNKINATRVPIQEKESIKWLLNLRQSTALIAQPERCVHVGDRESDIYELFSLAVELGTHFLVRTCMDRLAGDSGHTIAAEMAEVRVRGLHRVAFRDARGESCEATLEIRYRRINVLPPIGKQKLTLPRFHVQQESWKLELYGESRCEIAKLPKRQYTEEFKVEAIRLAESVGGHEAARRLGVPVATLGNWKRRRAVGGSAGPEVAESPVAMPTRRPVS